MTKPPIQLELGRLQPSFDPEKPYALPLLPPSVPLNDPEWMPLLIEARTALAHLDGLSSYAQNPLFLISPFITRESVESSGIENVNTTIADVFEAELMPETDRKGPEKEVLRYRNAIFWGALELEKTPLSRKIILGVFERLMPRKAGGFRKNQNQIMSSLGNRVIYTPPIASSVGELIANWEKFLHAEDVKTDPLIRCIVCHYQFEAIHPFNDGNGRTGRILMILQLIQYGLLHAPILFLSAYILREREEYYRVLRRVTEFGEWNAYIVFMLKGFVSQAEATRKMIEKIHKLFADTKNRVQDQYPRWYSADLIEHLFNYPITTPTAMAEDLGLTYQTASKYLKLMEGMGLLKSRKSGTYKLYMNFRLLSISRN